MTDSVPVAEPSLPVIPAPAPAERRGRGILGVLLRSPGFLVGAVILLFWTTCALFAPSFVPYDPYADDLLNTLQPPSVEHWFGTDQLGRDVFSRVLVGARDILTIAPLATIVGTVAGTAIGLITGYFGGWVDAVVGRLLEVMLSLPLIIVALLVLVALGPSTPTVVVVVGLVFAPLVARTVRAAVLTERHLDYVAAAAVRGEGAPYIMVAEILPNILPPIIVEATVRLGYAIFTIASLSFLGFGVQPPSPDWGLSIAENYGVLVGGYWWTVVFDTIATASLIVGVNLVAESLQRALAE
ncbi:peptide/nickel transport system permease protein [Ancylobacter sp. 3268]|uniref:ABC transporter permease n=1 Tax=Ancylobacter sp. 3268 TaxID=2817752 RepID=UPI0028564D59|nr:ABC transporter permease [Ancylobacter sp. 3268]MDR6955076.1 peptide/nickel transport system permease protein [Ancylobacter sp. 3268]